MTVNEIRRRGETERQCIKKCKDSVELGVCLFGGHKIVRDVVKEAMASLKKQMEEEPLEFAIKDKFKRFDLVEFDVGGGKVEQGVINHQDFLDKELTRPIYGVIRWYKYKGEVHTHIDMIPRDRLRLVYRAEPQTKEKQDE